MKFSNWIWPIVIIGSSVLISWILFSGTTLWMRPFLALWFLLICPGMALVRFLGIQDSLTELVIAIALSLGLDTAVAMVMLYIGFWSIQLGAVILIGMSTLGAIIQIISASRHFSAHLKVMLQNG